MAYPQVFLDWEAAAQQRWQEIGEQRGLEIGEQRGLEIGEQRGLEIGAQEKALTIALRLLRRRIGALDQVLEARIGTLSTVQLEDLSEAVLDFATVEDLNRWIQDHPVVATKVATTPTKSTAVD